jgi:Ca2+-binding RTX toxin-like protein
MGRGNRWLVLGIVLVLGLALLGPASAQEARTLIQPRITNDDFADAWAIGILSSGVTGHTNDDATLEPGEPDDCAGREIGHTAWYTVTVTQPSQVTLSTAGANFDTVLAVYTGSAVGSLSLVSCNDDAGGGYASQVVFPAVPAVVYYVQVGGYQAATGLFPVSVTRTPTGPPAPQNDYFVNAQAAGVAPTWQQGTWNATTEPGEPLSCNDGGWVTSMGATVWYTLTVAAPTLVTVDTFGSDFDTILSIYTGGAVGSLTRVVCDDDTDNLQSIRQSQVQFGATPGTTYRIQVGGYDGTATPPFTGNLKLHITRGAWPSCLGGSATIVGTSAEETINGTPGADVIVALGGKDTINGQAGDDRICGNQGWDTVYGGPGNDRVQGGAGNDTIWGGEGNDNLRGGPAADTLRGEAGDDRLLGQGRNDLLYGGPGTDTVRGGGGTDYCEGETLFTCE